MGLAPRTARQLARRLVRASNVSGPVEIAIVPSSASRRLNRHYRGKGHPANVLSFDLEAVKQIVLDRSLLVKESREYSWPVQFQFARMTLHGLLHVSGHTHSTEKKRNRMERVERTVLAAQFPRLRRHPTISQFLGR